MAYVKTLKNFQRKSIKFRDDIRSSFTELFSYKSRAANPSAIVVPIMLLSLLYKPTIDRSIVEPNSAERVTRVSGGNFNLSDGLHAMAPDKRPAVISLVRCAYYIHMNIYITSVVK